MDEKIRVSKSNRLKHEACPVCMGKNLFPERMTMDHISHDVFSILKCRDCTLRFIADPPLPGTIGRYYDNEAGTRMHRKGSGIHQTLRNILLKDELKPLTKRLLVNSEVIDFGAGDGAMSALLKDMGYKVTAMDMHPEKEWLQPDIEYHQVDLNTPLPPYGPPGADRTTRAAVMRHVLEHLYDPVKTLLSMRYADVSYVLIITPNYNSILRPLLGESWYYWDPPRHLTYFNPRSIYCLAERCGYRLVETTTYAIDELVTSFYRRILLNSPAERMVETNPVDSEIPPVQFPEIKVKKKGLAGKIAEMTSPKSPLAALSSVVASFFGNCVIHAVLERYKQPQGILQ